LERWWGGAIRNLKIISKIDHARTYWLTFASREDGEPFIS
jgi:hypothetical protein